MKNEISSFWKLKWVIIRINFHTLISIISVKNPDIHLSVKIDQKQHWHGWE